MQVCRICLNTDKKMYIFDSNRIHLYEQITGTTFACQDLLPKYVCWECGYYMSKFVAFKSKAIKSQCVLTEILNKEGLVTKLNCQQYRFSSSLSLTDVLYLNLKEEETESSEIKIENEYNKSDVSNFINVKDDVILVVDDDDDESSDETVELVTENQSGDETLMTGNSILFPPSNNGTIENKYSVKGIEKSPANLSCNMQRKRKKKEWKFSAENKKSHTKSNNQAVKRTSAKRKRKKGSTVNERNVEESFMDKIDKDIINFTELTLDEQIAEIQNRKESLNYKNSPYKCEKCFKGFLDDDAFARHMTLHADSSGALECPLCRKRYASEPRLSQHMAGHVHRFSCLQCDFYTNTLQVAQKHQNFHKGKRHACPHCDEIYIHRTSLLGHIRKNHPSDFICAHCGLSFLNDKGLTRHVKWVHRSDQKQLPEGGPNCALCDIRFASQEAFDNHVLVSAKHAQEREQKGVPFSYRKRKKAVTKKQGRKKSSSTATSAPYPDGPRQCEQCDEKLPNPRAYHIHFKNVHKDKNRTLFYNKWGERHMCEICGKLLQSAAVLRSHQYAHSDTKEFKCERCGKQYQLEVHLWNHQRHHCGTRVDYPCSVCGRTFSSKNNCSRHMVTHSGNAYKCELCDKVFNCPSNKKNHIDFVHKKKPWPKRNRGPRRRTQPEGQPQATLQDPPNAVEMQEEWNNPSKL